MSIVLDHIEVRVGNTVLLSDISAQFARGRVSVVIGPNGAGKTTLLKTVLGLVAPANGHVSIDGARLSTLSPLQRARQIAYLAQSEVPAWNVTVRELVALGRIAWRGDADDNAVSQALIATDTLHLANRSVDTLSGGECARAMFARVLAGQSNWIIADEPLANLDMPHQRDLLGLMRRAAHQQGKGVITVMHELNAAAAIADDVYIMRSGAIIANRIDQSTLSAAFGMEFDLLPYRDSIAILPRPI